MSKEPLVPEDRQPRKPRSSGGRAGGKPAGRGGSGDKRQRSGGREFSRPRRDDRSGGDRTESRTQAQARYDGPPPPRSWADRDPVAAARLSTARSELAVRAKGLNLPVENLLTPDFVRRLMWEPPDVEEQELPDAVANRLGRLGARGRLLAARRLGASTARTAGPAHSFSGASTCVEVVSISSRSESRSITGA